MKKAADYKDRCITISELEDMLSKYNIGRKPLSRLLGWGETTILLYLTSGEIPDGEYGRRLFYLYKHPGEYLKVLEERGAVLTDVARKKTTNAVLSLSTPDALLLSAQYITNRHQDSVELSRIEAVLFFSQIISLVMYHHELFADDFHPDSSHLPYRKLTEHYNRSGVFKVNLPQNALTPEQMDILDTVSKAFDWYGPRAIESILRAEHIRFCGEGGKQVRRSASKERIRRYYTELFSQNNVSELKDFELYIHKRMTALRKQR